MKLTKAQPVFDELKFCANHSQFYLAFQDFVRLSDRYPRTKAFIAFLSFLN